MLSEAAIRASIICQDSEAVGGFGVKRHNPSLRYSESANTSTYNTVLTYNGTLNASGSVTLDLYAVTTALNVSLNCTKVHAFALNCRLANTVNTGGKLRLEPGAANPANTFLGSNTHNLTLNAPGCILLCDGSHAVLSATARNLTLSNPGTNAVIFAFEAVLGP